MATKKKSNKTGSTKRGRKGGPIFEGSPITIGGGGGVGDVKRITTTPVWCEFDHEVYQDPGGGPKMKRFENENLSMHYLRIAVGSDITDLSPFLPADGDCKVTVHCQSSSEKLTIRGEELGIEFHTGKYLQVSAKRHSNPNGNNYVGKVEIKGGGLNITKEFGRDDYFAVQASNLPFEDRASRSRKAKR